MNTNTNKIVESINVKVDECFELNEERQVQEPKDYKNFMYYYEGMPTGELEIPTIEQVNVIAESHPIVIESHLDIKLHIDVKQQIDNVKP